MIRSRLLAAALLFSAGAALAQTSPVPTAAAAELQQMASHAGVIFAGQVIAVTRNDAAGFVDVRFRIDQALRGCPASGAYVLREWAGLWAGKPDRYRVGQRRLMLLSTRGQAGMNSPIGGLDGAIPLVATATEPLASSSGVAPADASAPVAFATSFAADLRWIQARAVRTLDTSTTLAKAQVTAVGGPAKPWPVDPDWSGATLPLYPGNASAPPQPSSLAAVFALLRTDANAHGADDARY